MGVYYIVVKDIVFCIWGKGTSFVHSVEVMGWDTNRFPEDPDPDLLCCICQGVLEDAVVSPCEHVFCSVCIKEWLKESRTCPNCRRNMNGKHLKQVIPLIKNLISRLKIFCDYKEKGCEEITTIDGLQQHLRQCNFAPSKRLQESGKGKSLRKTIFSSFRKNLKPSSKIKHCMSSDSYNLLTSVPVSHLSFSTFNPFKAESLLFCFLCLTYYLFVSQYYLKRTDKYVAKNYNVIIQTNRSDLSPNLNPLQLDNFIEKLYYDERFTFSILRICLMFYSRLGNFMLKWLNFWFS